MQTLAKGIGLHWCWGFFVSFGEEMHTIIEVISIASSQVTKIWQLINDNPNFENSKP